MNIFLLNNGTKYLSELKDLLKKYGRVTENDNKESLKSVVEDLVVLSGGHHHSVLSHPDEYQPEKEFLLNSSVPVLGICLGAEIIAYSFGALLESLKTEEKGLKKIKVLKVDKLFSGITDFNVYESHKWAITKLPDELEGLAKSNTGFEVIKHKTKPIFGFQFHPEMFEDKSCGYEIFDNLFRFYLDQ